MASFCSTVICAILSEIPEKSAAASFIARKDSAVSFAVRIPCSIDLLALPIISLVLSNASAVWSDKTLICCATTAKPFPASPALAASMEAFKAKRPVCEAISSINWLIVIISCISLWILSIVTSISSICLFPSSTRCSATSALLFTWLAFSSISSIFCIIIAILLFNRSNAAVCSVEPS